MASTAVAVGAIGVILLLGVFLTLYSKKKSYPLTLLLLLVGILLGPVLGWFKPQDAIDIVSPFVTLALIMILFDAGYALKLHTLLKEITKPLIFGTLGVVFTIGLVALPFKFLLGISWYLAVLFGALLASTDLTIITPMLEALKIKPKLKRMLEIESTVNSILAAVFVIIVVNLLEIGGGLTFNILDVGIRTLLYNIFVGVGIGLIGGFILLWVIKHATAEEKPHILFIAALFMAFAIAEIFGASGIAAALVIGIVFGNSGIEMPGLIKSFGGEMELILITFVYVILGAIIDFGVILNSIFFAVLAILLVYLSRYLGLRLTRAKEFDSYKNMILLSSPRGILCAVLTLSYAALFPDSEVIIGLVFAVILVSATLVFFIPHSLKVRHHKRKHHVRNH